MRVDLATNFKIRAKILSSLAQKEKAPFKKRPFRILKYLILLFNDVADKSARCNWL